MPIGEKRTRFTDGHNGKREHSYTNKFATIYQSLMETTPLLRNIGYLAIADIHIQPRIDRARWKMVSFRDCQSTCETQLYSMKRDEKYDNSLAVNAVFRIVSRIWMCCSRYTLSILSVFARCGSKWIRHGIDLFRPWMKSFLFFLYLNEIQ